MAERTTKFSAGRKASPKRKPTPASLKAVLKRLKSARLKATKQRLAIGALLFKKGDRHVTAEGLYDEIRLTGADVSLATLYNTMRQFVDAGLLREIAVYGSRTWYDTNVGPPAHYYLEDAQELWDIPEGAAALLKLPAAPQGVKIIGADIIIRVRCAALLTAAPD